AVLADMALDGGHGDFRDHRDVALAAGDLVPMADPALRIGIEDGDAVALACKLGGENQGSGGLAGAALGIGKCDDWHGFLLDNAASFLIALVRRPGWNGARLMKPFKTGLTNRKFPHPED